MYMYAYVFIYALIVIRQIYFIHAYFSPRTSIFDSFVSLYKNVYLFLFVFRAPTGHY